MYLSNLILIEPYRIFPASYCTSPNPNLGEGVSNQSSKWSLVVIMQTSQYCLPYTQYIQYSSVTYNLDVSDKFIQIYPEMATFTHCTSRHFSFLCIFISSIRSLVLTQWYLIPCNSALTTAIACQFLLHWDTRGKIKETVTVLMETVLFICFYFVLPSSVSYNVLHIVALPAARTDEQSVVPIFRRVIDMWGYDCVVF